ncbi:MAG: alanine racemase [Halobacteriaceae archaeon]
MVLRTAADSPVELYDPISELETPAVVVDLDAMERNIEDYASFADEHGVALRSHAKTHKIPALAHRQHDRTGAGIVCQSLGEVEVFADAGVEDIYLTYMVVGDSKLDRLVRVSENIQTLQTTVDGPGNIEPLQAAAAREGATVEAVLEIDIGLNRVGVAPEDAPEMAEFVAEQPNLDFAGVMAYEGHINGLAESHEEYEQLCWEAMEDVAGIVDAIEDRGVPVGEVKVGSTGTSKHSGKHPVVTEINPGMYPFNDVGQLHRVSKADCAATVLTSVISAPTDDRVVVDAGSKTMSMDVDRLPVPKGRDDLDYYNYSEEHGWVDTSAADDDLAVGDRLEFIVPHVCTTINLHDTLVGVRDGRVEAVWDVAARGKVR